MQATEQIDSDSWLAIDSPEFAARFGRLLTTTRRRSKTSVEELAAAGLGFDATQLARFEQGSTTIDESVVAALCLLYSADVGQVLPVRRPVTIADRRLCGAGASVEFSPDDPTSLLQAYLRLIRRMRSQRTAPGALRRDDILVLSAYLHIDGADVVARLSTLMNASPAQRKTMAMLFATGAIVIGLTAGGQAAADSAATPRDASVAAVEGELVVAEIQPDLTFDSEFVVITDAVAVAAAPPPVLASPTTARVRAPASPPSSAAVTAPAAAPAVAPLTLPTTPPVTAPVSAPIAESTTTIAEPAATENVEERPPAPSIEAPAVGEAASLPVIAQVADVVGLSPATRLQVAEAAPASTVASEGPTPNQSGCNPDPSEAVMSVVIPDIAYTCPVYAGGQATIDAGFVTLVTDAGVNPVLATRPGEPGTLWLAGHRSTNGAAFAKVPDLADGALVTVSSDGSTATYRIVGRAQFEVRGDRVVDASGAATAAATWASVIRDDLSGNLAPRLVLQTCEGEQFRWMIYADLVT